MDREKADKFLNLQDKTTVERIAATHDNAVSFPSSIVQDVRTFDGSNARSRHRDRGELLGVIDRLLGTTAHHFGNWQGAEDRIKAHKTAYEKAAAELNTANAKLDQYQSFGTLSPWFGGPFGALEVKPSETNRVFGKHNGVSWSFAALSERVTMLEARNAEKLEEIKRLEKQNGELAALADKPMQILDDAQGYYTVTDPFDKNASITVKQLVQRNLRQKDMLDERDETVGELRRLNDEWANTTNRKDEKILEQAKEIKALKSQTIPLSAHKDVLVEIKRGSIPGYNFGSSVIRVPLSNLTQMLGQYENAVDMWQAEVFNVSAKASKTEAKLRQTQEDLGDMTVAHDKACETIDALNARLDKINDMALDISDVADGTTEPEFEEDLGVDHGSKPGYDFTIEINTFEPRFFKNLKD